MPTNTYTPLGNTTLASAVSSVTFGSIPATYRDLVVIVVAKGSTNLEGRLRLNGDTGNNYSFVRISGTPGGGGVTATNAASQSAAYTSSSVVDARTDSFLQLVINIMDYSATDKHKTILNRADNAARGAEVIANRWENSAAVTSVTILTSTGNWAIGSTMTLYGIVA